MKKSKFWKKTQWFVYALLAPALGALAYSIFPPAAFLSIVASIVLFVIGIVKLFKKEKYGKTRKK